MVTVVNRIVILSFLFEVRLLPARVEYNVNFAIGGMSSR